jgi:hypothetical protein
MTAVIICGSLVGDAHSLAKLPPSKLPRCPPRSIPTTAQHNTFRPQLPPISQTMAAKDHDDATVANNENKSILLRNTRRRSVLLQSLWWLPAATCSLALCTGGVAFLPVAAAVAADVTTTTSSGSSTANDVVVVMPSVPMKLFVDPQGLFVLSLPQRFFVLRRTAKGDLPDETTGKGRRGSSILNAGDLAKAEVLAVERCVNCFLHDDTCVFITLLFCVLEFRERNDPHTRPSRTHCPWIVIVTTPVVVHDYGLVCPRIYLFLDATRR